MSQKSTVDLMIDDLKLQIMNLSGDRATYRAIATNKEVENKQLKQEIETLKKEITELKEPNEEVIEDQFLDEAKSAK
ncbi:hypothetical protein ABES80_13150 [Bacillus gobiensis]|uniref:hypothetical protein n=1 Tax=Bacillus gobiensis TaxID=1441095 RepID=UPI003D1F9CAE